MSYLCPVCQYPGLHEPARSARGNASLEICPSCGFQFGVDDEDRGLSHAQWRERWVQGGMKWSSHGIQPPTGWDPARQISGIRYDKSIGSEGGRSRRVRRGKS